MISGWHPALPVWHLRPRPRHNLPLPPTLEGGSPLRHLSSLHLCHCSPFWKRKEERHCCPHPTLRRHCCLCRGTPRSLGNCFRERISQCHDLCLASSPIHTGDFPISHPPPSLSCAKGGLGVAVYLLCLPEKLLPPGTVDLWGSSHQLWHALIFSGGQLHTDKD